MSSKIYFTPGNTKNISWLFIRVLTSVVIILPQYFKLLLARRLLLKPVRRIPKTLPDGIELGKLATMDGDVQLYRLGQGPGIILSHGWSGSASQMFPLMAKIANAGFQAIAYDQLGHGRSARDDANLFLFIKTKQCVLAHIEAEREIKAIVSHSMAAPAALHALTKPYPLLLIAPAFRFVESMFEKIEQSGVRKKLLTDTLNHLEQKYKMQIDKIDPVLKLGRYANLVHILHDENDRYIPISDSIAVVEQYPEIPLTRTRNLGHSRIINSDEAWQILKTLLLTLPPVTLG